MLLQLLRARQVDVAIVEDWRQFAGGEMKIALSVSGAANALLLESPRLALITEELIFGERAQQARRRRRAERDPATILKEAH